MLFIYCAVHTVSHIMLHMNFLEMPFYYSIHFTTNTILLLAHYQFDLTLVKQNYCSFYKKTRNAQCINMWWHILIILQVNRCCDFYLSILWPMILVPTDSGEKQVHHRAQSGTDSSYCKFMSLQCGRKPTMYGQKCKLHTQRAERGFKSPNLQMGSRRATHWASAPPTVLPSLAKWNLFAKNIRHVKFISSRHTSRYFKRFRFVFKKQMEKRRKNDSMIAAHAYQLQMWNAKEHGIQLPEYSYIVIYLFQAAVSLQFGSFLHVIASIICLLLNSSSIGS